jgi:Family of unknown function (DUF6513)
MEHIVFLTGHLAQPQLHKVLAGMADAPFTWEVRDVGVQVAALMTADLIRRRVPAPLEAQRMIVPGRCRGDMDALSAHYSVPVQRGPDEMKDLPQFFNQQAQPVDLSQRAVEIFAEIVDAPRLTVAAEGRGLSRQRRLGRCTGAAARRPCRRRLLVEPDGRDAVGGR